LDLLIRTFDVAKEAGMLPVMLHMNNLRPMYEKWLHGEQAKWWTHVERFDIMQQPREFRCYIMGQYRVVATLASNMVIASTTWSSMQKDGDKKKEGQGKQGGGGKPPRRPTSVPSPSSSSSSQLGVPSGHRCRAAWGPMCARRLTCWRNASS
jgi:hypothetical protein